MTEIPFVPVNNVSPRGSLLDPSSFDVLMTLLELCGNNLLRKIAFKNDIPGSIVNHFHFPLKPWRLFLSPTVEKDTVYIVKSFS